MRPRKLLKGIGLANSLVLRSILSLLPLALLFGLPSTLSAQQAACGTLTDPSDRLAIESFYQRIRRKPIPQIRQQANNTIAIKFHVVRADDGSGGLNENQLQSAVNDLNSIFADINLSFAICGEVNFVNSSEWSDFDAAEENALTQAHKETDLLNIYILNSVTGQSGGTLCGYAYYPWVNKDFIFLDKDCVNSGNTFAHEMGHYLGLLHTHGTDNNALTDELVDGSNCQIAGDRICDTPADPQLGNQNVNSACVYTGDTTDANGDTFVPDPSNIMSYSPKICRTNFSAGQYNTMFIAYRTYHEGRLNCPSPAVSRCEADSLQLVSFYNNHGGDSWNNPWDLEQSMDKWYGLTIDGDGCPTEIDLSGNNLSGRIQDLALPKLTKLYANNNSIGGNLPNFSGMPNLEKISLTANNLSGSIPDFSQLPKLDFLVIESNQLSGNIPDFSAIPNLRDLGLGDNKLQGNIPDFSNIPELRVLSLWKNQLTGNLPAFNNTPKLIRLTVGNNQLEGNLPNMSQLNQMESMDLWVNQFSGDMPNFDMPNLQKLDASNNQLSGIPAFSNMNSLSELVVNNNQLTFEDLLPNKLLKLSNYKYGDQGIVGSPQSSTINAGNSWSWDLGIDSNIQNNNYDWFKDGELLASTNEGVFSIDRVRLSDQGTYSCKISNPELEGITLESSSFQLNVEGPNCTLNAELNIENERCGLSNGSASVTIAGGFNPYSILWSTGSRDEGISSLDEGTYSVTITDDLGCEVNKSFQISNSAPPVLSIEEQEDAKCGISNGLISIAVEAQTENYSFAWDHGPTMAQIDQLAPGNYALTVTDENGCSSEISVAVLDKPSPVVSLESYQDASCGLNNGEVSVSIISGQGPYEINWSNGGTGEKISQLEEGDYSAQVIDANGCTDTLDISLLQKGSPVLDSASVINDHCANGTGSVKIVLSGGQQPYQIDWSNGQNGTTAAGLKEGVYQFSLIDANGCTLDSAFSIGNEDQLNTFIASIKDSYCNSPSGRLEVGIEGALTQLNIRWSNGDTGMVLDKVFPGTYTAIVEDLGGCMDTLDAVVNNLSDKAIADFEYELNERKLSVTNLSQHADSFYWDFGNNFFSILENPVHEYESSGEFTLMLIAVNGCNADTSRSIISIQGTNTSTDLSFSALQELKVYPNPADQSFKISWKSGKLQPESILLNDIRGRYFSLPSSMIDYHQNELMINTASLPEGLYILRMELSGVLRYKKLRILHP